MAHIHEKIDFTVAIFVVHDGKILLIHHRKLDKWLPLGGHIELDEDPEQAALREAKEESGLDVELLGERPPTTSPGTRALIAPRFLDIHRINDTHEHIGMIYWARPKERRARPSDAAGRPYHACRRRASRHPLVFRRGFGQTPAADDRRGEMVLPPGHPRKFQPVIMNKARRSADRLLHHRRAELLRHGPLFQLPLFFHAATSLASATRKTSPSPRCIGLIYAFAAWQAGRFAQRCGYFTALKIGFGIMIAGLAVGSQLSHHAAGVIAAACVVQRRACVSSGRRSRRSSARARRRDVAARRRHLQYHLGRRPMRSAYFIGGTLIEKFGYQSIFYVPLAFMLVQLALTFWLEKHASMR